MALLTASAAADAIRRGDITSEALVTACLDRIAATDPSIGAFAYLDRDRVLAEARTADDLQRLGRGTGALHGVPVAIKDIIDVADQPIGYGLASPSGQSPRTDATCVAALRGAGAIMLGKTVTTELATFVPSKTANPRNLAHTPGGSSAGSAAAVAGGMVPLALGTQTAGSIIRPASYCGVYGFKPTRGLISRRGALMQSHTLDTIGVFARSLDDLALSVDVMAAYDPLDDVSYRRSQPQLRDFLRQAPPLPPLFAYVPTPAFEAHAEPAMKEAFAELIDALMPHNVEQIETPSLATATAAQAVIQLVENTHHYGPFLGARRDLLTPALADRLDTGRSALAGDYLAALDLRETLYGGVEATLRDYSAILTLAAPSPAPLGLASTGNPIFNGLWTFLGCPCVSLPLMETEDGLPMGVQLVGARGDDARLLRTARWLLEHTAGQG